MIENNLCSVCEYKGGAFEPEYIEGRCCIRCGRTLGGVKDGILYFEGAWTSPQLTTGEGIVSTGDLGPVRLKPKIQERGWSGHFCMEGDS